MIENLPPLTQEQRQGARRSARNAVIRSIGDPRRKSGQFPTSRKSPFTCIRRTTDILSIPTLSDRGFKCVFSSEFRALSSCFELPTLYPGRTCSYKNITYSDFCLLAVRNVSYPKRCRSGHN